MFFKYMPCLLAGSIALASTSCSKTSPAISALASLNLVHAVMSPAAIKLNSNERDSVKNYTAKIFGLGIQEEKGNVQLFSTANPAKDLYNAQPTLQDGGVYSLFLYGLPDNPQALWQQEIIPARYQDSVVGVRLAHLAQGIGQVQLKLGAGSAILLPTVEPGTISTIVQVPLPTVVPTGGAKFDIWDPVAGKSVASYTLPASVNSLYPGVSITLQRFKNITLVLRGSKDSVGANAPAVFPVALSY